MTRAVRVLCRSGVATGFALAGLRPEPAAAEGGDTGGRLRELVRDPAVGVVLVESGILDAMPVDTRRQLARRPLPMVIPFPGPQWEEPAEGPEAYIVELLRQVIGYRVKLR